MFGDLLESGAGTVSAWKTKLFLPQKQHIMSTSIFVSWCIVFPNLRHTPLRHRTFLLCVPPPCHAALPKSATPPSSRSVPPRRGSDVPDPRRAIPGRGQQQPILVETRPAQARSDQAKRRGAKKRSGKRNPRCSPEVRCPVSSWASRRWRRLRLETKWTAKNTGGFTVHEISMGPVDFDGAEV